MPCGLPGTTTGSPGPARFYGARTHLSRGFGALSYLGRRSYECYLFHAFALFAINGLWRRYSGIWHTQLSPSIGISLTLIVYLGMLVLGAGLIGRYFADPANRLLRSQFGRFRARPAVFANPVEVPATK